jgi:hypothetical protein
MVNNAPTLPVLQFGRRNATQQAIHVHDHYTMWRIGLLATPAAFLMQHQAFQRLTHRSETDASTARTRAALANASLRTAFPTSAV